MWTHRLEPVLGGRGARCFVSSGAGDLSFDQALQLLRTEPRFRSFVSGVITSSEYVALRWETPPIARSSVSRPFEFVLVADPFLDTEPEPAVFAPYFLHEPVSTVVRVVPNLGHTAQLVVPRELVDPRVYAHLLSFLKGAPDAQVHALWQCVAVTASAALSDGPVWVSTAGGGVSWLHVRIERVPKYYVYGPYRDAA
jgi:hypothetical protein